jgi:hypothetical protein
MAATISSIESDPLVVPQ